jgi:ribonuclease PH
LVDGKVLADLCYEEDVSAQVDMNLVLTGAGQIVEVQGTAEHGTFSHEQLHQLVEVGNRSIQEITRLQSQALGGLPGLK